MGDMGQRRDELRVEEVTLREEEGTVEEDEENASLESQPGLPEAAEEGSSYKRFLCFVCRGRKRKSGEAGIPGLGLLYTLLASVVFSVMFLLVKTIKGVHAVEISAIRCFFQMLYLLPTLIYYRTGFIGPRNQRIFLILRGCLGSNAMIFLFYAVHQMPVADATVIIFSNPVFTSILAWVFLKERCSIWDAVFTIFTLTGVVLIARPPFLFGSPETVGATGSHIKGSIAALVAAVAAACTYIVLRKMGKNVHYYLSMWYYAVSGFIECIVVLFVLGEWTIPNCGWDRWNLMLIGLLGLIGQTFLTKALQIEKAGLVAVMRTLDVVMAFILQYVFLNESPTWLCLVGALCVISSTTGLAVRKLYKSTRKKLIPKSNNVPENSIQTD